MNAKEIKREARELVKDGIQAIEQGEGYQYEDEFGEKVICVHLGTIYQLLPSGKMYTFWACSNLEPCPRCKGEGCDFCGGLGSREAYEDEIFREALEYEAEKHGYAIDYGETGEDIYLTKYVD